jgi:hypothetical protein
MVFKTAWSVLFLFVMLFPSADISADSYRCGRKIVRTGDSVSKLLTVCGEPRLRSSGRGDIEVRGVSKQAQVQRWHYKKSRRSLEHIVLVYKGKIAAIEVGGR